MKIYIKNYSLINLILPLQLLGMHQHSLDLDVKNNQKYSQLSAQKSANISTDETKLLLVNQPNAEGIDRYLTSEYQLRPSSDELKKQTNDTTKEATTASKKRLRKSITPVDRFTSVINNYFLEARYINQGSRSMIPILRDTPKEIYSQARFENGATIFHKLASVGALETIKYLVMQNNFDPSVTDDHGKTPLDYASQRGTTKICLQYLTASKNKVQLDKSLQALNMSSAPK